MKKKYIIGLLFIAAAFLYLVWTSFSASFQFGLTPTELFAKHADFENKTVKVSGTIKAGSIVVNGMDHDFIITNDNMELSVHYRGIVPNTFREGAEVVATGRFTITNNVFEATQLLTKCASKYETKK